MANLKPLHKALIGLTFIVLANWACSGMGDVLITVTPTATERVLANPTETQEVLPTVSPTATEVLANDTQTPEPIQGEVRCVVAPVAVYLRPVPNIDTYPISPVLNGMEVTLTGSRLDDWVFVEVANVEIGNARGWMKEKWLGTCEVGVLG